MVMELEALWYATFRVPLMGFHAFITLKVVEFLHLQTCMTIKGLSMKIVQNTN
jgi:hypothetical protein